VHVYIILYVSNPTVLCTGYYRYVREHVVYIWSPFKYVLPKGWKIEHKKGIKERILYYSQETARFSSSGCIREWINSLWNIHYYYYILLCLEHLELHIGDHTDFIDLIVESVRKLFKTRYRKQANLCNFRYLL